MTLGLFENFPANIHRVQIFNSTLPIKQLQQRLLHVFFEVNRKELSFEEVANPTIPKGTVIFEFGLAENADFNYIDRQELEKAQNVLEKQQLDTMDFFCLIRYYKDDKLEKKTPLKFDYYLLRTIYGGGVLEIQVAHEKGPRYLSPEDLTTFIFEKVNAGVKKKILKFPNA